MTTFIIILALIAAGFVIYKTRVPLMAKILGQPESRVRRRLEK